MNNGNANVNIIANSNTNDMGIATQEGSMIQYNKVGINNSVNEGRGSPTDFF